MSFLLAPLAALVYWILLVFLASDPRGFIVFCGIFFVCFLGLMYAIGGRQWYKEWLLWFNYALICVFSVLFVLIVSSPSARNAYVLLSSVFFGILVYSTMLHFSNKKSLYARTYLEFIYFSFIVSFWQINAFIYFVRASLHFSFFASSVFSAAVAFLLAQGIITAHGLKKSSELLVLAVVTTSVFEVFFFLDFLPVHYYVQATLLTLWFFFLVQMIISGQDLSSRRGPFRFYSSLLFIAVCIILMTAIWN